MDRKPLPRSLRYRRPLVVPPPLMACGRTDVCHLCMTECRMKWLPVEDTKKPGAPME